MSSADPMKPSIPRARRRYRFTMTHNALPATSAALASGLVTAIDHVGIAVPDLDAAVTWYGAHLGLVETHREVNEGQGVHEAMLSVPGTRMERRFSCWLR